MEKYDTYTFNTKSQWAYAFSILGLTGVEHDYPDRHWSFKPNGPYNLRVSEHVRDTTNHTFLFFFFCNIIDQWWKHLVGLGNI